MEKTKLIVKGCPKSTERAPASPIRPVSSPRAWILNPFGRGQLTHPLRQLLEIRARRPRTNGHVAARMSHRPLAPARQGKRPPIFDGLGSRVITNMEVDGKPMGGMAEVSSQSKPIAQAPLHPHGRGNARRCFDVVKAVLEEGCRPLRCRLQQEAEEPTEKGAKKPQGMCRGFDRG